MKRFSKFIAEARAVPDTKKSSWEELKPYSDDLNSYITFTAVEKVGINPSTSYNTPVGIYAYPLAYSWVAYDLDSSKTMTKLPFASNQPWITLFTPKDPSKVIDLAKYSSADWDRDIAILKYQHEKAVNKFVAERIAAKQFDSHQYIQASSPWNGYIVACRNDANVSSPGGYMWNLTRMLSKLYEPSNKQKQIAKWTAIMYKDLGWHGAVDSLGKGIIHQAEPIQAVFFSSAFLTPIKRIANIDPANAGRKSVDASVPNPWSNMPEGLTIHPGVTPSERALVYDLIGDKVFQTFAAKVQWKDIEIRANAMTKTVTFTSAKSKKGQITDMWIAHAAGVGVSFQEVELIGGQFLSGGFFKNIKAEKSFFSGGIIYGDKVHLKDCKISFLTFREGTLDHCEVKSCSIEKGAKIKNGSILSNTEGVITPLEVKEAVMDDSEITGGSIEQTQLENCKCKNVNFRMCLVIGGEVDDFWCGPSVKFEDVKWSNPRGNMSPTWRKNNGPNNTPL